VIIFQGVGELKILHHQAKSRYRLILRREQIFKLVLNQLITSDVHMSPMENSTKAFCWGGMNYAEGGSGEAEQLAIRFKNEDLANKFKIMIEECQAKVAVLENNLNPEND
jgi:E3 SUMO-protein ligase RanBP2